MQERKIWLKWSNFLHHWGLDAHAGILIDAAGPLRLLMAQVVMIAEPFLRMNTDRGDWSAVVKIFEDPEESESFTRFLNKEGLR